MITSSVQFGDYEILQPLQQGGMATVYLARDKHKRLVALKILAPQFAADPNFRLRFRQEADISAQLDSSPVVPLYDFGEYRGQPYIAMKWMSGGTLEDRLQRGPLPLDEVKAIMLRISAALSLAHKKGFVHRDIKPGNILFDETGSAFLGDFGIARQVTATASSTVVGTPLYSAPEQIKGEQVDARTDIYQMGVLLFEMLAGTTPFRGDTGSIIMQHLTAPPPHISQFNNTVPLEFQAIINKAMQKNKQDRFVSGEELLLVFKNIRLGQPQAYTAPTIMVNPNQSYISKRTQLLSVYLSSKIKAMNNMQLAALVIGTILCLTLVTFLINRTIRVIAPEVWGFFGALYLVPGALAYKVSQRRIAPILVHLPLYIIILMLSYDISNHIGVVLVSGLLSGAILNSVIVFMKAQNLVRFAVAIIGAHLVAIFCLLSADFYEFALIPIIGSPVVAFIAYALNEMIDGIQKAQLARAP